MAKRGAKSSDTAGSDPPAASESAEDAVRRRAYELYLEGGGAPGRDVENWLEAEREINARPRARATAGRTRRKT